MFVGTKDVVIPVTVKWDLSQVTQIRALLLRPDETKVTMDLGTLDFDATNHIVNVPVNSTNFPMPGVYTLQLWNGSEYSEMGSIPVSYPVEVVQ